jgi:hypothetical protein
MTRDEVLAMKPGPGLSALVGEHVINECRHDFERCGPNFWNYQCRKCGMEDSNFVKKLHVVGENKPYSTDIAAMWEVEEMIYQKGLAEKYITNLILITGSTGFHLVHASPADRCKAALLAVMDGEDKRGR